MSFYLSFYPQVLGIDNPQTEPRGTNLKARSVFLNENNHISVQYVTKHNFYCLAGGGIDPEDKDPQSALLRECLEETGHRAEIIHTIGVISEHKPHRTAINHSYITRSLGKIQEPDLTELEITNGIVNHWLSIDEAIQTYLNSNPSHPSGIFAKHRDLALLRYTKNYLNL